jgi:hypothetical protein
VLELSLGYGPILNNIGVTVFSLDLLCLPRLFWFISFCWIGSDDQKFAGETQSLKEAKTHRQQKIFHKPSLIFAK